MKQVAQISPVAAFSEQGMAFAPARSMSVILSDLLALTKPRITLLVMITAAGSCYVGEVHPLGLLFLLQVAIGTGLLSAGTAALNQRWEYRTDILMRRTAVRPLPMGRLQPYEATGFGLLLIAIGAAFLALGVNLLSACMGLLTTGLYLLAYTPLKRRSPISTLVGAFPGAGPILMGWAAARNHLDAGAWILFGIQFLWQFPHFLAIAWLYREEYDRAGICMLPVVDPAGQETSRQILLYSLALLPVSLLPSLTGITGALYFFGALLLGLAMVWYGWKSAQNLTRQTCRQLLHVSIIYLPLLFILMGVDHGMTGWLR